MKIQNYQYVLGVLTVLAVMFIVALSTIQSTQIRPADVGVSEDINIDAGASLGEGPSTTCINGDGCAGRSPGSSCGTNGRCGVLGNIVGLGPECTCSEIYSPPTSITTICNPGEWAACGANGCNSTQSAKCNDNGTGWLCISNPATCQATQESPSEPSHPQNTERDDSDAELPDIVPQDLEPDPELSFCDKDDNCIIAGEPKPKPPRVCDNASTVVCVGKGIGSAQIIEAGSCNCQLYNSNSDNLKCFCAAVGKLGTGAYCNSNSICKSNFCNGNSRCATKPSRVEKEVQQSPNLETPTTDTPDTIPEQSIKTETTESSIDLTSDDSPPPISDINALQEALRRIFSPKIVVVGDSNAEGYGLEGESSIDSLLAESSGLETENLGEGGSTASRGNDDSYEVPEGLSAEVAVVIIGTNDALDLTDSEDFREGVEQIVDDLLAGEVYSIIIVEVPHLNPPYNCIGRDCPDFESTGSPNPNDYVDQYNEDLREYCNELGSQCTFVETNLESIDSSINEGDGVHYTEVGAEHVAEQIFPLRDGLLDREPFRDDMGL